MIIIENNSFIDKTNNARKDISEYTAEKMKEVVECITRLLTGNGVIGIDFFDVVKMLENSGISYFTSFCATGNNRAEIAANEVAEALKNKLNNDPAAGIIINFLSSDNLSLTEFNKAVYILSNIANYEGKMIYGHEILNDNFCKNNLRILAIATKENPNSIKTQIIKKHEANM